MSGPAGSCPRPTTNRGTRRAAVVCLCLRLAANVQPALAAVAGERLVGLPPASTWDRVAVACQEWPRFTAARLPRPLFVPGEGPDHQRRVGSRNLPWMGRRDGHPFRPYDRPQYQQGNARAQRPGALPQRHRCCVSGRAGYVHWLPDRAGVTPIFRARTSELTADHKPEQSPAGGRADFRHAGPPAAMRPIGVDAAVAIPSGIGESSCRPRARSRAPRATRR